MVRDRGQDPARPARELAALLHFIHEQRQTPEPAGELRMAVEIFLLNSVARAAALLSPWFTHAVREPEPLYPDLLPPESVPLPCRRPAWKTGSTAMKTALSSAADAADLLAATPRLEFKVEGGQLFVRVFACVANDFVVSRVRLRCL